METPPKVNGGHRRAMSDDCDVIIHDVEDGVVLVVDNRDKVMYTMRFDFGASENLKLVTGDGVEKVADMKCNLEAQPGTVRNLCHLRIVDRENSDHFEMKYRVQCLVRNAKGELEQVKPPAPKPDEEERKALTSTLTLVLRKTGDGIVVFFENAHETGTYHCELSIAGSANLDLLTGPDTKPIDAERCSFSVGPRTKNAYAKLAIEDPGKAPTLKYDVKHDLDDPEAKKKAAEEAAAKKKAEDDARRKAEADAAAKKKAEEDAAKAAAEEEAKRKAAEAAARAAAEEAWRKEQAEALKAKLAALEAEEAKGRERILVEERGKWVLLQREYRHSICNLCRALFRAGQDMVEYKIYKLHKVCYDKAPKCDWCGDILIGEYVVTKGDLGSGTKLHKECIEPYKKKARPVCVGCNQQIMDDQWSSAGGKPYHHACRK